MNLLLPALNGSEPLAFLAALGALRGALRRWPEAGLSWSGEAFYQPALHFETNVTEEELVSALIEACRAALQLDAFTLLGSDMKVSPETYRNHLLRLSEQDDPATLESLEYFAAFGSDAVTDRSGKKLKPTALHMTAGQQQFLDMAKQLLRETTPEQMHAALFAPWKYKDPGPAMRWDTSGERLYALEARNPSGNPVQTIRGANALGILAIPFFPVAVEKVRLRTRGFYTNKDRVEFFVWPLWEAALSAPVIGSLLGDPRFISDWLDADELRASGILALHRSQRDVNDHGYGILRPVEQIL